MLTADTITDEQIRVLWAQGVDTGNRILAQTAQVALGIWHGSHNWEASNDDYTPWCAKWQRLVGDDAIHIRAARSRCAELFNARSESTAEAGVSPVAITIDTLTDDDLKEAISWLDTDICALQAALKIKRGPLVAGFRKYALAVIDRRGLLAEVLNARAKEAK